MARRGNKRKNRYAHLVAPQEVFDFHDLGPLTGQDVKHRTLAFIAEAHRRGLDRVRIVTGRGVHSRGRLVVKPQVKRTLDALIESGEVASYGPAKDTEGGDGALDVVLP